MTQITIPANDTLEVRAAYDKIIAAQTIAELAAAKLEAARAIYTAHIQKLGRKFSFDPEKDTYTGKEDGTIVVSLPEPETCNTGSVTPLELVATN